MEEEVLLLWFATSTKGKRESQKPTSPPVVHTCNTDLKYTSMKAHLQKAPQASYSMVEPACQVCWHSGSAQILAQSLLSSHNPQSIQLPRSGSTGAEEGQGNQTQLFSNSSSCCSAWASPLYFPTGKPTLMTTFTMGLSRGLGVGIPHSPPAWCFHTAQEPSWNPGLYLVHPADTEGQVGSVGSTSRHTGCCQGKQIC